MRYLRRLGAMMVAVLGLGLLLAAPAQSATAPVLFVNPDKGPAGATFEIVAAGFGPREVVQFLWDGGQLTVAEADWSGNVSANATVPRDAAPGNHQIDTRRSLPGPNSSRTYSVTPSAAAAPTVAPTPAPAQPAPAPAAAPAPAPAAPATDAAAPAVDATSSGSLYTAFTPVTVPDTTTAEVAFDVKVPLPLGPNPAEPPELLLLTAFALFSATACRTVALGRRLRVW